MRRGKYAVVVESGEGCSLVISPVTQDVAIELAEGELSWQKLMHPTFRQESEDNGAWLSPDESQWFDVRVVHIQYDLGVELG